MLDKYHMDMAADIRRRVSSMGYIFAAVLFGVAGYIASLSELPIPGQVIAGINYLQRPWTYFISASIASFGLTVALLVISIIDKKLAQDINYRILDLTP